MKFKKVLALALSAMMAMSVLAGCGGGGGGVRGTLSTTKVESELRDVESNIELSHNSELNMAVRDAASELAESGSLNAARSTINNAMGWGAVSAIKNAVDRFLSGLGLIGGSVSYGTIAIVEEDELEANVGSGGWAALIGANRTMVSKLAPINTPEKFGAALVLALDGTVGQVSEVTNNIVGVEYSISGAKATTPDGVSYWVFATQIRMGA